MSIDRIVLAFAGFMILASLLLGLAMLALGRPIPVGLIYAVWVLGPPLVLAVLTFVGASLSLSGFVPEKLSHIRTFAAQLAAAFATLVSPPTVGAVASPLAAQR